ncbi:MAG: glycoside hydrolase family 88 protein [Bacteroidota bacterium]
MAKSQPLKKVLLVLTSFCLSLYSARVVAQAASSQTDKLRVVADAVLKDATFLFVDEKTGNHFASPKEANQDVQLKLESRYNDWRYWNGVLNLAMMNLGEALHEPAYTEFAVRNIAFSFDNYGYFEAKYKGQWKWEYPFGQRFIMEELDDCGAMGASVIEVYCRDPQTRYRPHIDSVANFILERQDRLEDSTLVRPFPQKWTIWVDDLYMSVAFLARMGELTHEGRYFDDAARQVINFHKHLFDENMGLMHHCWYSHVDRPGVAFWGRGNGWAMLAQVDLLDRLPKTHPQRQALLALLQRHILGIARYQSAEGLWHQLLDKEDSYLETSCTAMFAYAIARAVNKGYIEPRYASIAQRAWEGLLSKIHTDGQVEGVCTGTGVSDDLVYYYRRPAPLNDVHGIGAVLLAGAEVLQLPK